MLEKRLLDAARELWRGGEESLTMRALARAANTHAPGIYSRFHSREAIIGILLAQFEEELAATLTTAVSVEAATELYLEFAINHPNEYQSFFTHRGALPRKAATCSADELGSVFRLVQDKLSKSVLLEPEEHRELALTIWTLWHGAAALLIDHAASTAVTDSIHRAVKCGVAVLMQDARAKYSRQPESTENVDVCHPA